MSDTAYVLHEKHGTRVVANPDAALKIVTERLNEGWWYDNWDEGDPSTQWEDRARKIVADGDNNAADDFLTERQHHEYEGFEVQRIN